MATQTMKCVTEKNKQMMRNILHTIEVNVFQNQERLNILSVKKILIVQ
jgi:hypothetical protein